MIIFVVGFVFMASLGAFLRFQSVQFLVHPWGTLVANVLGSLLIGFLAVYLGRYSPQTKTIILVAFLGSLTTFSSYALEVVTFIEEGLLGKAFLYFSLSNILCFIACFGGWKIAHKLVISS